MFLLLQIIDLYSLVVLVAVVLSWLNLSPSHPVVQIVNSLTEPLLNPIRQILPPMGGFDFSPLVLLFGLRVIRGVLLR